MSDILRQVDEDLRKERLSNLWKKYGLFAILSAIFLVIGFQLKSAIDKSKNERLVQIFIDVTNEKNVDQQLVSIEELIGSSNVYLSGLAELKMANLQIQNNSPQGGLLVLKEIINNDRYEPIIKDLATYYFLINKIDEITETEIFDYLDDEKLKNSKFRYLFKELILIKKFLNGKSEESVAGFQELVENPDSPSYLKQRAAKFIKIMK